MMRTRVKLRRSRAFTLVEMLIVVAVFAIMGGLLAYLSLEIAYQYRQSISQIPAQEQAFRTMSYVRSELLPAAAETIVISQDGTSIQFANRARGTNSSISFVTVGGVQVCEYDPDVTTNGDERIWGRGVSGSFELVDGVRRVLFTVRTRAVDRNNEALFYAYSDEIAVRN